MATTNLATNGILLPTSAAETALAAAYPTTFRIKAAATGATAGTPGAWTPALSQPPQDFSFLLAAKPNAVTASPGTAWTTGQYVETACAPGQSGRAYWNGTAWVQGTKP